MRREICSPNMANGKKKPRQALCNKACRGLIHLVTPTRSCQKFSKQICLWDLAQSIDIISIIQIVEAI